MAQPAHPQPQDDFPFLLPRTMPAIIAATMRIRTALMMIVAIFSISHASIESPPVCFLCYGTAAKQQIPAIYSFNPFRYWIYIVELLILAAAPLCYEFATFTFLVSFVASLYGLNSI